MSRNAKRPLNSLSDEEMARYCRVVQNMPAETTGSRTKMMAGLAAIGIKADTLVDIPAAAAAAPTPTPAVAEMTGKDPEEFVLINLHASEMPGGQEPVFVGVNGVPIWIPRAQPVRIRRKFMAALSHAVRTVHDPDHSNPLGGTLPPRDVPDYPFTVLADPAPSVAA